MTELEIGSTWSRRIHSRYAFNRVTLVGMDERTKSVWVRFECDSGRNETFSERYFLSAFEIDKAFFEEGKTYKFSGSPHSLLRYRVREVGEFGGSRYAITERTGGTGPLSDRIVVLELFEEFEEA